MAKVEVPLFEGLGEVRILGHLAGQSKIKVDIPKHVVVPPGYQLESELDWSEREPTARYRVVKMRTWRGAWLRYRYPFVKE